MIPGQLLLALALLTAQSDADPPVSVEVRTRPSGAAIILDGQPVGKAPLSISDIAPGLHRIVAVPSTQMWGLQPKDTTVVLMNPAQVLTLNLPATLRLSSNPRGALIFEDGVPIGYTPLYISRQSERPIRLSLRAEGRIPYSWIWIPRAGALHDLHINPHPSMYPPTSQTRRSRMKMAAYLGTAAVAMAAGSVLCSREADQAYERYVATAHPDRLVSHFRRAERMDRLAGGLWAGFQLCVGGILVWWLFA